jgi:hypothetical protein
VSHIAHLGQNVILTHTTVVGKDDQRFQLPSSSSAAKDFVTFLWPLQEEKKVNVERTRP